MALDRFALDWKLDMSNKWRVIRTKGDIGSVPLLNKNIELAGSGTATNGVIVNVVGGSSWGTGTYNARFNMVDPGTRPSDTTHTSSRAFTITQTVCLYCEVTTNPVTTWVAWHKPDRNVYDRNWALLKDWKVAASDVSPDIPSESVVTFSAGPPVTVTIGGASWATDGAYEVSFDRVRGHRASDNKDFTIIRRACLLCRLDGSGGNSWVAVEGG